MVQPMFRDSAVQERSAAAAVATVVPMRPTEVPAMAAGREATDDRPAPADMPQAEAPDATEGPTMFAALGPKRRRFFFRTGS